MLPIRPLHNKIFFQFEDRIVLNEGGMRSFEDTHGGIVVTGNKDDTTKKPRWVKVIGVGPEVDDLIQIGDRILVEALRWTEMYTIDGVNFWQTNDSEVMATTH